MLPFYVANINHTKAVVLFPADVKFRQGEYMSLKKLSVDGSTRDDSSVRSGASVDDLPGERERARDHELSTMVFQNSVLANEFLN